MPKSNIDLVRILNWYTLQTEIEGGQCREGVCGGDGWRLRLRNYVLAHKTNLTYIPPPLINIFELELNWKILPLSTPFFDDHGTSLSVLHGSAYPLLG